MKIAIDGGPLVGGHSVRGIGAYTRELVEELGFRAEVVDLAKVDLSGYDVIHYPYFGIFTNTLPLIGLEKAVVTIHDVIPLIYPKHYPPGLRGSLRLWQKKLALKKVGAVITDTETSKKDIVRFLDVPPEKVHVVYLAPAGNFKRVGEKEQEIVRKKYKLPKRFVLYVGDVNYNKNIPNLIRACRLARLPLVIVGKQAQEIEEEGQEDLTMLRGPRDWLRYLLGKPHPELAHYRGLFWEFRKGKVIRLGFVPEMDLVAIYNLATVYCQPSFYEGFGLPVLEALACGTPVVASRTQALLEIAEGVATFVDPRDIKAMARALRNPGKVGGLPRAYSWVKTVEETMVVYAQV